MKVAGITLANAEQDSRHDYYYCHRGTLDFETAWCINITLQLLLWTSMKLNFICRAQFNNLFPSTFPGRGCRGNWLRNSDQTSLSFSLSAHSQFPFQRGNSIWDWTVHHAPTVWLALHLTPTLHLNGADGKCWLHFTISGFSGRPGHQTLTYRHHTQIWLQGWVSVILIQSEYALSFFSYLTWPGHNNRSLPDLCPLDLFTKCGRIASINLPVT